MEDAARRNSEKRLQKMADESKPDSKKAQVFDLEDTSVETVYANTSHVIVGEGDVTLYFGFQPIEGNNIPASNVKRVTMTHDSFMRMMEFWAARYRLLESLYDGRPRTLRDINSTVINAAFDKMLGRIPQEAVQNGTGDGSEVKAEPSGPTSGT